MCGERVTEQRGREKHLGAAGPGHVLREHCDLLNFFFIVIFILIIKYC